MQIDSKPNSVYELNIELGTRSNINKPNVENAIYTRQAIELLPFKLRLFVRLLFTIGSKASNCTAKSTPDNIDGNIKGIASWAFLRFCLK